MCQQIGCCWRSTKVENTGGEDVQAGGVLVGLEQGHAGGSQGWQQGLGCLPQAGQSAAIKLQGNIKDKTLCQHYVQPAGY